RARGSALQLTMDELVPDDGRFRGSRRCLIPATAFFEFTGQRTPNTKRDFTLAGQPFFCIAGIWRDGAAGEPPDFTMLTTAPGPGVATYRDRVPAVRPADCRAGTNLPRQERARQHRLRACAPQLERWRQAGLFDLLGTPGSRFGARDFPVDAADEKLP